ncbi:DUF177 domain-containing protein [Limibacter armeniacum]|uniref:YceD family protein n=1 Tax=Limibacter armeniacum TaxID=466084 RepID=UPI002FE637A2
MKKKANNAYSIDIYNLSEGKKYEFSFHVDNSLFEMFSSNLAEAIDADVEVLLSKGATTIQVDLKIKGETTLICDRSLDSFNHPIEVEERIYFKFGDHFEELDDNLIMIPENELSLDLSQALYDIISLEIPIKKIHPDLRTEEDEEDFDDEEADLGLLFFTTADDKDEEIDDEGEEDDDDDDKPIDPRWEQLKKLK